MDKGIPAVYLFLANYIIKRADKLELVLLGPVAMRKACIDDNVFAKYAANIIFDLGLGSLAADAKAEQLEDFIANLDFETVALIVNVGNFYELNNQ